MKQATKKNRVSAMKKVNEVVEKVRRGRPRIEMRGQNFGPWKVVTELPGDRYLLSHETGGEYVRSRKACLSLRFYWKRTELFKCAQNLIEK